MNDYKEWLESGKKSLAAGRMSEARRLLMGAVQANPKGDEGWVYLAATLPPQQAYDALQRAVALNPQNLQAKRGIEILEQQLTVHTSDPVESLFEEIKESKTKRRIGRGTSAGDGEQPFGMDDSEIVRKMLTQPYREEKKPKPKFWWILAPVVGICLVAILLYFFVFSKPSDNIIAVTTENATTSAIVTTATDTATTQAELITTGVQNTTTLATTAIPTTAPNLNLKLVQNEQAKLKGFSLIFTGYDNRSTNFSFAGAGTAAAGKHFEGVQLEIENTYNRVLPIDLNNFQGIDSRNRFLSPVSNGRLPMVDLPRLLAGESRTGWLTFELEDGTSLRRIVFTPVGVPDDGNSAEVSLVLPPATPLPARTTERPTVAVTPTPRVATTTVPATIAPSPTIVATTVQPTITPIVAITEIVALVTSTPLATATPFPTATPEPTPTATPLPTATPSLPTAAPTLTPFPSPTPLSKISFNQKGTLGDLALTVSQYLPTITAKPTILPTGYHYESVKITVDNNGSTDVSEFLKAFPFYLRDGNGKVYTVGPYVLEAKDRFDPFQFATTSKGAGKTKVAGVIYFLVSDTSKTSTRTLVFYSNSKIDSPVAEFLLK